MQSKSSKWIGHGIYVLIMAMLIGAVYFSGKSINYNWHWDRLWPYVVNTEMQQLRANGDGTAVVKAGQLTIEFDDASQPQIIDHYTTLLVGNGDLVFQGDAVAQLNEWKFGPIAHGLWVTVEISFISLIFAVLLGLVFGLMRVSKNQVARNLSLTYVELIRGTPLLVQIFIVYFFIGTVLDFDRFTAGVVALSVFTGAYVAEIVRAGIQAIPTGQMEAARSLGMTYPKAMRYIILPQALKRTLPPLAGQFINLIKDSSLVSVISITDLTKAGREVVSGSFAPFEVWFTVAALYLLVTGTLSWAIQRLEKRLSASD
ncbi:MULTISPECIES: amino acid ABC transporter permease [Vibrio]|uniref:Putative glutamine transport system permease protein GlnP n=1 Tax=Vibrio diazotrophicus TaxID=685 RepID=A0A2J8G631_VIBDI|nr:MULTISPECIES: amino acid ABC transporter permease [Vibrio]MCF7361552.1 amino acid ABC transporter permease [Vibrio sp. A1-b2]MCZ4372925.1 amino acid ABC transporter permease [Vibrio diazotrophicus]PNH81454.1 amino acid ABC transporter permease [Vibrio diazotrophicus]PNI00578.1 amino acid ABC transporter permease [Vibrio diazotrophicus]PNI05850.1 amino acid ABC transporter permease [Vibrio diazotrophicus]